MHRLRPQRGVANDPATWELPEEFWSYGLNVRFRDGKAMRIGGDRDVYATVQDDVRNLLNAQIGGSNYWIYHGTDKSYAVEGATHTDITHATPPTGSANAWDWTSGLLNGLPFANSGADNPWSWDGNIANNFVDLTDWPANTTCKAMIAHRFHLFALDITVSSTNYPTRILWSDAAQPGAMPNSWTASAATEAGSAELAAFGGPLMTGASMLETLALYSRKATWAADYVRGANNKYEFRPVFSTTGVLTRHGAAVIGDGRHAVVTDSDIILTDLVSRQSLARGRMANWVFSQINTDNYEALFTVYDPAKNELWVCFPSSAGSTCDLAAVYNFDFDTWQPRELPDVSCGAVGIVSDSAGSDQWNDDSDTWESDGTAWNEQLYSLSNEALVLGEPDTPAMTQPNTGDAVAVDATLQRLDMTMGDPERVKFVRAVHVRAASGYGTLYVRLGARNSPSDSISWDAEFALTEPEQIAYGFAVGRYISVQIRSDGSDPWELTGLDFEYERRGYH